MSVRRRRTWRVLLPLLALVALATGLRLDARRARVISGGGVVLSILEEGGLVEGGNVQMLPGDFLLQSDSVRVVVGGSDATPERRLDYGTLLDATASEWDQDSLAGLKTILRDNGRPVPLVTERVEPVRVGTAPAIRVRQRDASGKVALDTTVTVDPGSSNITLTTTLSLAARGRPGGFSVGDEVSWPSRRSFIPGIGYVDAVGSYTVPWFGRGGRSTGYALAFPEGPTRVDFIATPRYYVQRAWGAERAVRPGSSVTYQRVLATSFDGLAGAAASAWRIAGEPVGRIVARLEPRPSQATIDVVAADGTPELSSRVSEDGIVDLHVRPGSYIVELQSAGGRSTGWVDVDAGGVHAVVLDVPETGRLTFRVTDSRDRPLPARLVLSGIDGTPDPDLGPDSRAEGAGNEIHSALGIGTVDVPPGRYRVSVSRGFEYSIVERDVVVDDERGAVVQVILLRDVDTAGWISADFHVHAEPSTDSEVSLMDRVASLAAAGVELAVATDHNHITDYAPAVARSGLGDLLHSTIGVEVTTEDWGHFNVFPLTARSRRIPYAGIGPDAIFRVVRRREPDAVIQVNHPWMAGYGYFQRAALDERKGQAWKKGFSFDFDTIEVMNGFETGDREALSGNLKRWFALLEAGRRFTAVGNSDSHRVTREWAGYPRTYVRAVDDSPSSVSDRAIAAALKGGHAIVSNGPFISATVEGSGPGDTAVVAPGIVRLALEVAVADWVSLDRIDVVVGGETVDVLPVGLAQGSVRLSRDVDLDVRDDTWVVVVATGSRPLDRVLPGLGALPFAFTNPIWIDVDEGLGGVEAGAAQMPSRVPTQDPGRAAHGRDAGQSGDAQARAAGFEPPGSGPRGADASVLRRDRDGGRREGR